MEFYLPAAIPMLYYDEETINAVVDYLCSCENEPTPQEVSEATGISIEICEEKVPVVLELNRRLLHYKNRVRIKRPLKDYLD